MKRTGLVASGLVAAIVMAASAVMAQGDVITQRKDLMKGIGGATRTGAAIAKGEAPFDAAKVQEIFKTYAENGQKFGTLLPAGSSAGDTTASPKIWEDMAGFNAQLAKFVADSNAAATASKDLASFRTAFGDVTKSCGTCHETYRVKKN
jgi:cytochrome c556